MIPWDAKKLSKKTKKGPNASKNKAKRPPRPETQPEKSRKGLQEGAWGPRGAPEANQGRKVSNPLSKIAVFKKNHQKP